jgi:hypothetical protein
MSKTMDLEHVDISGSVGESKDVKTYQINILMNFDNRNASLRLGNSK